MLLKMLPVESCNGRPLFLHRSSREDVETVKAEKWTGQSVRCLCGFLASFDFKIAKFWPRRPLRNIWRVFV